jgi:hypothetical protein
MPGRGCKPQITRSKEWNENRGVHRHPLCSRDPEGRESTPYLGNKQSHPEDYCPCIDQDHRFSLVASGFEVAHVLCSAVYDTHSI